LTYSQIRRGGDHNPDGQILHLRQVPEA